MVGRTVDPAHGYWRALKNPAKAGLAPRVILVSLAQPLGVTNPTYGVSGSTEV